MGNEMSTVKAALVQTAWTGDKDSMIDLHEKHMRQAAAEGAQVMCCLLYTSPSPRDRG